MYLHATNNHMQLHMLASDEDTPRELKLAIYRQLMYKATTNAVLVQLYCS